MAEPQAFQQHSLDLSRGAVTLIGHILSQLSVSELPPKPCRDLFGAVHSARTGVMGNTGPRPVSSS